MPPGGLGLAARVDQPTGRPAIGDRQLLAFACVGMLGRRVERAALDSLLTAARQGMSRALVLHGEAGIGKTSLLDHAARTAEDFEVVRVDGFESERDLAFAGVHRLVVPFLAGVGRLPGAQRAALESAFGLGAGEPANRFLVGLATLSLLAEAASTRPVLCVVDDAHCLDDESLAALGFVARRLHADRIAMLFASRGHGDAAPLEGISTLLIQGLPDDEAHELLGLVVDGPLDVAVAKRVVSETRGSPMALIEIGKGLSDHQLLVGELWSEPIPLSGRLEAHFVRQVQVLPAETQALLLVASAEPSGGRSLIEAAAAALGLPSDAADAAEHAGVIVRGVGLRFRHPLVRSAVYGGTLERRPTPRPSGPGRGQWCRRRCRSASLAPRRGDRRRRLGGRRGAACGCRASAS